MRPEALEKLRGAASSFERLGRRAELGRCLIDLGRAEERTGGDPAATFRRAREALEDCGAPLFLAEVSEAETGGLGASPDAARPVARVCARGRRDDGLL